MLCLRCSAETSTAGTYCPQCGNPFAAPCAHCGCFNPTGARFCLGCGRALARPVDTAPPPRDVAPSDPLEGERKTITILFADIKGSMAMIEHLDPEDARAIVDPALGVMMEAVRHYDGRVAQSTGDGIFAFFGAPMAHEDHARRALHAALRMQEQMRILAERFGREKGIDLQIRVGLNTGEVVVRSVHKDEQHSDYVPVGHAAGLAQRMQAIAAPGAIVASESTLRLTEGYFRFKPLGLTQVKGASEPVAAHQVLGLGPLRTPLQRAVQRGLSPFVGRERELEALRRTLVLAHAGSGRVVSVVGEPGQGKSRLLYELKQRLDECTILETFSVSHGARSPYLPIIDLLRSYFGVTADQDEPTRRQHVTGRMVALDPALAEGAPYVLALLGTPASNDPVAAMDPQTKRQRTLEAIRSLLVRESVERPLVIIVEDLHWIDEASELFLDALVDGIPAARVLLLVSHRPEYRHRWGDRSHCAELRLDPLPQDSAEEMLAALFGDDPRLTPMKRFILEKTAGNPLFIEEMVRAVSEQGMLGGAAPTGEVRVPTTIQGILAARIDRLALPAKDLVQTLAVLGRDFPVGLIRELVTRAPTVALAARHAYAEEPLRELLAALREAQLVYEQPASAGARYMFKHALTQEVAYGSLLIERRRLLHEHAGDAIEAMFADTVGDHVAELAHHYRSSRNTTKAITYLHRAGEQAVNLSAHEEASSFLNAALDVLQRLPESAERARSELELRLTLTTATMALRGYASTELEQLVTRMLTLCAQVDDAELRAWALVPACTFHVLRADLDRARELGEEMMRLVEGVSNPSLSAIAPFTVGLALYFQGDLPRARAHLERAIASYDPATPPVPYLAVNLGVTALSWLACVLVLMGHAEEALTSGERALRLSREQSHPVSICHATWTMAVLHHLCGHPHEALKHADATLALAVEHGFPQYVAVGGIWRGVALSDLGRLDEGFAQVMHAIGSFTDSGTHAGGTTVMLLLVSMFRKAGQREQSLATLGAAMSAVTATGERHYEAELLRLKGELACDADPPADAEAVASFEAAIALAREQSAKLWELRAVTSLARFLSRRGRWSEAQTLLTEACAWPAGALETEDMRVARAMRDATM